MINCAPISCPVCYSSGITKNNALLTNSEEKKQVLLTSIQLDKMQSEVPPLYEILAQMSQQFNQKTSLCLCLSFPSPHFKWYANNIYHDMCKLFSDVCAFHRYFFIAPFVFSVSFFLFA